MPPFLCSDHNSHLLIPRHASAFSCSSGIHVSLTGMCPQIQRCLLHLSSGVRYHLLCDTLTNNLTSASQLPRLPSLCVTI